MSDHIHPTTGQPIGAPVNDQPALRPGAVTLAGRYGRVEKLVPAHAATLWDAVRGHDSIWTYMSQYGPFADAEQFSAWVAQRAALDDPYAYAIVDPANRTLGIATLMDIQPDMRVIEVGHIVYSPALQRTPLGTEAQYLLARYAFETLGYRRYEWKCNSHNAASRRAALRFSRACCGNTRSRSAAIATHSEWPVRKRNFEHWLSPENFATDGKQKVSLRELNGAAE